MICPKCNGKGSVYNALGSFYEDCGHCQGTGMVRVEGEPMTEQEYLQTCTTEQLAEWIVHLADQCTISHECNRCESWCDEKRVVEWLKQPHTKGDSE